MTFLPIVERELRVAARRPGTHWVRGVAALVPITIGVWYLLMSQGEPAQEIAVGLFRILTGGAVLYCLLSGMWFTADCLSSEKREGTLGLLFLTDLKGYDVVVGKLVATSLNGFYAVLAVVPIMAVPLLLGGVTAGEFGRMALVVVNTLFFSLTLGICASAMSRSGRRAMDITFLVMLLFTVVLPAWGVWRAVSTGNPGAVGRWWPMTSAGFSYHQAFDQPYRTGAGEFWWSLSVIHGLGWLFLVLASVIAPRSWQERPASGKSPGWRQRWQQWSYGNGAERAAFRRRLLDRSAYYWLAARARWKPVYVWALVGLVAGGLFWGLVKLELGHDPAGYLVSGWLVAALIKGWFALEAGRALADDRQQGALELVLATPLTVRDILRGQLLALQRQFLGPVVAVLLLFFVLMILGASNKLVVQDAEGGSLWLLIWPATMVLMVADLAALFWAGMWEGLTAKDPTRAAARTVGRVLVLPWVATLAGTMVMTMVSLGSRSAPGPAFAVALWFAPGLVADLVFGGWARHNLLTGFRAAATRRYEPQPGFWKRLLSERNAGNRAGP